MQPEARSWRMEAVAAHPLAELLECPPEDRESAQRRGAVLDFDAGRLSFASREPARGSTWWFQDSFCAERSGWKRG
jgi:hypothetical protein